MNINQPWAVEWSKHEYYYLTMLKPYLLVYTKNGSSLWFRMKLKWLTRMTNSSFWPVLIIFLRVACNLWHRIQKLWHQKYSRGMCVFLWKYMRQMEVSFFSNFTYFFFLMLKLFKKRKFRFSLLVCIFAFSETYVNFRLLPIVKSVFKPPPLPNDQNLINN